MFQPTIDIANAVVAQLSAMSALADAQVSRVYVPVYDVEEDTGIKVFVMIRTWEENPSGNTRDSLNTRPTLLVAVMNRIEREHQVEQSDAMLVLTGTIVKFLRELVLPEQGAEITKVTIPNQLYDPVRLDEGLFMSAMTVQTNLLQKRI